ncbi:MAG: low molecular weight protein-tyrosine-phosphatase [Actinomycetales bacterium]
MPDLSFLAGRDHLLITMVCYGNICRSPMAAAVLNQKVKKLNLEITVDSAGTSNWHVGQGPNPPSKKIWESAGYQYEHVASQFNYSRLVAADLVLVMDDHNHQQVSQLATTDEELAKIFYLREFDATAQSREVPDPYSMPDSAFQSVLEMVERATDGLIAELSR